MSYGYHDGGGVQVMQHNAYPAPASDPYASYDMPPAQYPLSQYGLIPPQQQPTQHGMPSAQLQQQQQQQQQQHAHYGMPFPQQQPDQYGMPPAQQQPAQHSAPQAQQDAASYDTSHAQQGAVSYGTPQAQQDAAPYSAPLVQEPPAPHDGPYHSTYSAPPHQQPYSQPPVQAGSSQAPMQQPASIAPAGYTPQVPPSSHARLPAHRTATPLLPSHHLHQYPQPPPMPASAPAASQAAAMPLPQPAYPFPPTPLLPHAGSHHGAFVPIAGMAAGQYRRPDPDCPRGIGRGQYAAHSKGMNFFGTGAQPISQRQEGSPVRAGVRGPDGFAAKQNNADSLEHFMGGMAGSRDSEFRSHYGNQHAGKSVASHLQSMGTGIEGPSDGLAKMQGMRQYHNVANGRLQVRPEAGFMPSMPSAGSDFVEPAQGLRTKDYLGQESRKDHVQSCMSGLTAESEKPLGRRRVDGKSAQSNISLGPAGISTSIEGDRFPLGMRYGGPHKASYSHVVHKNEGIVEGGIATPRHNPFAGKTSESQLSTGSYAPKVLLGPNGLPLPARRPPYAGKTSETRISYDAGTLTVCEAEAVRPRIRGDPSRWGTTYDQMSGQA